MGKVIRMHSPTCDGKCKSQRWGCRDVRLTAQEYVVKTIRKIAAGSSQPALLTTLAERLNRCITPQDVIDSLVDALIDATKGKA